MFTGDFRGYDPDGDDSHYGKAAGLNYDFSDILLEENEELGKYEELDDYQSLVNRMIVNVSLNQN